MYLITSCAVGPDYKQPKVAFSKKYDSQDGLNNKAANLKHWWEKLNDPKLNELIIEAIEHNYDLSIALERIEETRSLYKFESAKLYPEITGSAREIRTRISQNISEAPFFGPPVQNFYLAGFDALWEIDIFGGLRRGKESAFYELQADQEGMRDVLITLLSDVARNYIQYISTKKLIKSTEKIIENQRTVTEIIKHKEKAGLLSLIEVENEIAELARKEKELIDLEKSAKQVFNRIAVLLGYQPEKFSLDISDNYELPTVDKMVSVGIPSDLLRRRPDIRKSERELAMATADIGVAVAELFPKFSLTGNFSYLSNTASRWLQWSSRTWYIGPKIDWNIFAFGKFRAQVKAKKHKQKQALLAYENTIILALEDVENALVTFFYENDTLNQNLKELNALKKTLELNNELLGSGLADKQRYLKVENEFLEMQKTYTDSKKNLINDLISLYKSLGGGWECI